MIFKYLFTSLQREAILNPVGMVSGVTASTASKLADSCLRIEEISPLGRGLVTKQAIPAGQCLVRLDPLISVLDDFHIDKACSTCFTLAKTVDNVWGKELLKCKGCGFLRYCSVVLPPVYHANWRHVRERIGSLITQRNASISSSLRCFHQYWSGV